jgi:hypothetical protein
VRNAIEGGTWALTDEGPDEADDVLGEVEEREVLEPPRLRTEPLCGPGTRIGIGHGLERAALEEEKRVAKEVEVLTESPVGRPG